MSTKTIIKEEELDVLKSQGTVYICRSCKDNLNKTVLINYKPGGIRQVFTGFCSSCSSLMQSCNSCHNPLPPSPLIKK